MASLEMNTTPQELMADALLVVHIKGLRLYVLRVWLARLLCGAACRLIGCRLVFGEDE